MHAQRKALLLFVACAIAAPGCSTLREQPLTPEVRLPAAYQSELRATASEVPSAGSGWRSLGDPELDALVSRALAGNLDLDVAAARIAAARSQLRQARSATRPQVGLGASANREQLSTNGPFGAAAQSGVLPALYDNFRLGLDVSWEWDLFGANKADRARARAGVAAAEADREALRLSIPAEVAAVYVEHLVAAQQAHALRRAVAAGERRIRLMTARQAQGDLSDRELLTERMQIDALKARLPAVEATRETLRHAMGELLGTGEYVMLPESSVLLDDPGRVVDAALPVGAPSDLLRRRPDLRSAEARFQQAFAERQFAIADQFPRFILSGTYGRESLRSGDLLDSASLAWTLVRQLTVPLMDGGRRSAERTYRQARLDAAVGEYRSEVVKALVDVEQSLLERNSAAKAMRVQEARLEDARRHLEVERARRRVGDATEAHVSEAEERFEQVWSEVLNARGAALSSVVKLQKSLGGPA